MSEIDATTFENLPRFIPVGRFVFDREDEGQATFTAAGIALDAAIDLNTDPEARFDYTFEVIV